MPRTAKADKEREKRWRDESNAYALKQVAQMSQKDKRDALKIIVEEKKKTEEAYRIVKKVVNTETKR